MERLEQFQNENPSKGNSEDSLLVIYILQILKKYSSPTNHLSSQDVMDHLREDYSIGDFNKADPKRKEKAAAQQKKVRRHLDTLSESYRGGCIKKEEGKTRSGHKWFYDISRDKFADKEAVIQETLTETEVEFLVDLISATKILNTEGTRGLIDKLLRKTSVSCEERERRLDAIQKEAWFKTPNEDLAEKKEYIEECFFTSDITFDYEDEKSITATPLGWICDDGICFLNAKVGNEHRKFSLDKIRVCGFGEYGCEAYEEDSFFAEETDSDKTALDSLLVNIPTVKKAIADNKKAIADKKCLHFMYRSYVVDNGKVTPKDEAKSILPHSLVFNDGKYYLIGIDENAPGLNKVAYFRVDLMFELYCKEPKTKLSDWDKHIFDTVERARLVEKHPLMLAGDEILVTFKVVESALDRVIDAFAVTTDKFKVTDEIRMVENSSGKGSHEERVISVQVMITSEEAFRWALANADVVEVASQDIRDRIARIADPVYQLYTQTLSDKVRENIDYVLNKGTFKINSTVDEDTAFATYKELAKMGKLGAVRDLRISVKEELDNSDYLGDFFNTERLTIMSSKFKDMIWASKLVNVKTLELTFLDIDDTLWMKDMKKLRRVYVAESSITDLSILSEHKEIDCLDINGTNIGDIGFIEKFPKLTQLNIATCPIADYSPLFTTQSYLKYLEIGESALKIIGEENIRNRHIGIDIKVRKDSPFWFLFE